MTEFVFGPHSLAEGFCRRMDWRPYARASWRKPDGTVVYFACFVEQLEAVTKGMTVYLLCGVDHAHRCADGDQG